MRSRNVVSVLVFEKASVFRRFSFFEHSFFRYVMWVFHIILWSNQRPRNFFSPTLLTLWPFRVRLIFRISAGILRSQIKSSVFPFANLKPVREDHLSKLCNRVCSLSLSFVSSRFDVVEIQQSSTKSDFWKSGGMYSKIVFIASKKSVQLIELPCGTPKSSLYFSESVLLIFTIIVLSSKKFWM